MATMHGRLFAPPAASTSRNAATRCIMSRSPQARAKWIRSKQVEPLDGRITSLRLFGVSNFTIRGLFFSLWVSLCGLILSGGKEVKCKLSAVSQSSCEWVEPNGGWVLPSLSCTKPTKLLSQIDVAIMLANPTTMASDNAVANTSQN
mgnify:CR=1 FL=1